MVEGDTEQSQGSGRIGRKACLGKPVSVQSVSRQEKAEKPPKLYDLTTLQREANRLYGYTAQQTLDYIQLLYEKRYHGEDILFPGRERTKICPRHSFCGNYCIVVAYFGTVRDLIRLYCAAKPGHGGKCPGNLPA